MASSIALLQARHLVAIGAELTLPDIQRHLDALGVAKYKWRERLEWVSDLPRSKVNKVDKKVLRERAAALAQASGQAAWQT